MNQKPAHHDATHDVTHDVTRGPATKHAHRQFTEPIFARLAEYSATLAEHPLLTAARRGELTRSTLEQLAFHQYSDSILWIPMLAQMKSGATRSERLRKAIEDNIAHEAGIGSTSHVALAVAMMRSLGLTSLESFPTRTFASSATLWLSDEFAHMNEPFLAGWLLTAETLVPQMFAAVVASYDAIEGADARYFHEHVHVDSDEHATWMAEAVHDVVALYGPSAVDDVLAGMADAWAETREVPDALWRKRIALVHNLRVDVDCEATAEHDSAATVAMLHDELAALGHTVVPVDANAPLGDVVAQLAGARCDLVFNIAEGRTGKAREAFWPALYEQLGLAYTGSDARVLAVCLDKALSKRIVAAAGVDVARGVLVRTPRLDELADVTWDVSIVKPNAEGSSKGITRDSVVQRADVARAVHALLARYPDGVLVEEFIHGVDVAVPFIAALGGVLPALTYENAPRILDYASKQRDDVRARVDERASSIVHDSARRAFAALDVCGFGRADYRVTPEGRAVFLEMNPLPSLATADPELFLAAAHAGFTRRDVFAALLG
jgi:D-alanine--D-alanine ligase